MILALELYHVSDITVQLCLPAWQEPHYNDVYVPERRLYSV